MEKEGGDRWADGSADCTCRPFPPSPGQCAEHLFRPNSVGCSRQQRDTVDCFFLLSGTPRLGRPGCLLWYLLLGRTMGHSKERPLLRPPCTGRGGERGEGGGTGYHSRRDEDLLSYEQCSACPLEVAPRRPLAP